MTELSPEARSSLSREELIALIVQLFAEVRQLRAEVERLKKPPTTSQNSSQPPSRDQKRNLPGGRCDRRVTTKAAQPRLKRYRKYRDALLVFLHGPQVPWHNNACERALRPAVIHRKVTGGFRSPSGADAYAALASVIDTAKLRGQSVFDTLVHLLGAPGLPYLSAQKAQAVTNFSFNVR